MAPADWPLVLGDAEEVSVSFACDRSPHQLPDSDFKSPPSEFGFLRAPHRDLSAHIALLSSHQTISAKLWHPSHQHNASRLLMLAGDGLRQFVRRLQGGFEGISYGFEVR